MVPAGVPAVATAVLPLLHVPPPDASVNEVDVPWQNDVNPLMLAGSGLTATVVVVIQPVASV